MISDKRVSVKNAVLALNTSLDAVCGVCYHLPIDRHNVLSPDSEARLVSTRLRLGIPSRNPDAWFLEMVRWTPEIISKASRTVCTPSSGKGWRLPFVHLIISENQI